MTVYIKNDYQCTMTHISDCPLHKGIVWLQKTLNSQSHMD